MYLVMKLLQEDSINTFEGIPLRFPSEIAGFVPVYKNYKDAEIASCDGKYRIEKIEVVIK